MKDLNKKENILSSWILLEQLSEGELTNNIKYLKTIKEEPDDWYEFFSNFLNTKNSYLSEKELKKSGLVLYFDIFNFSEISDILRKKYDIKPTYEEIKNSKKFSLAIFFDKDLNFIPQKLHFTVSGYIKFHEEFPENIYQFESNFSELLESKFKNNFNKAISYLINYFNTSENINNNLRYSFIKNVDTNNIHLHSSFIKDLNKAKKISNSQNLNNYFCKKNIKKNNLDSQKKSKNYNPKIFNKILNPKFYPLGRFPSNTEYSLSFMQQVAVNLCSNNFNTIQSVNGPPGTGKTTLLKDIFADLIVKQAYEICKLNNKDIDKNIYITNNTKIGLLPDKISQYNIVVASFNNGAVQNIVNELPKITELDNNFIKSILEIDYFKDISNKKIIEIYDKESNCKKKIFKKLDKENNWGCFSLEGGKAKNLENLLFIIKNIIEELNNKYKYDKNIYNNFLSNYKKLKKEKLKLKKCFNKIKFNKSYSKLQKSNPYSTKKFRINQSKLFINALKVRKQFLYENIENIKVAEEIWSNKKVYSDINNKEEIFNTTWQWINLVIPVISTTFSSFGRMFENMGVNSISNLFVDEAGQVLPQACVGAIFRSKKIIAVGDPSQIKPVTTLDSKIINSIAQKYEVDEKYLSTNTSMQSIIDDKSIYGFKKNEKEWIGIPLWVHRRSNYPMFTISNEISYNGLMVQGKPEETSKGISKWIDIRGIANDKFVKEQADFLKKEIEKKISENKKIKDDIYVITPFKNVANELAKVLDEINFTKKFKDKITNIGTVHTFQGKEAKIVYFVLGADKDSKGAANWAVSEANIMNVAVTRAKEEFYIIGDKELYSILNSKVINKTIRIIEEYNS